MLTAIEWSSLIWPIVIIVLTSGLVVFIRWFGNFENKSEAVGSDLNLVAFGFAIDLLVRLMKEDNEKVLPNWPYPRVSTLVPVVALGILNLVFYMINLRIGKHIEDKKASNPTRAKILKFVSIFLGIISAVTYIVAGGIWG
jgi:uncharacterized membrane protein YidH (DUF202 family)